MFRSPVKFQLTFLSNLYIIVSLTLSFCNDINLKFIYVILKKTLIPKNQLLFCPT